MEVSGSTQRAPRYSQEAVEENLFTVPGIQKRFLECPVRNPCTTPSLCHWVWYS